MPFLPIFLFVILFGLSMDYHVLILSRIRECRDRGASTDEAVAHGIKTTAGVVTSAAIVMVGVFAIFGTLSMMDLQAVRCRSRRGRVHRRDDRQGVLLPATMKLLGEWNWYLPRWLDWMPRFGHGEVPDVEEAEPTAAAAALGRAA